MSLIWGVWLGMGFSGGPTKAPIPRASVTLGTDLYGGLMIARLFTFQVSLYPNIQTAGTCPDNWFRIKGSLIFKNHELGAIASYLCVHNTGTYTKNMGNYSETYEYSTGAYTYGVGGFYNLRLTFIKKLRTYVGLSFLYPVVSQTVPLKEGESPAPYVSYPTVGFHIGWAWGRKLF
ncbi:MAG: hypothetical protein GXO39_08135 [Thermotogae bacterium]|nr:hypothetical protein [Thermotogota bacterium]